MQITIYNRLTGELGAVLSGSDLEAMTARLADRPQAGYVEGAWSAATHRVDLESGEVVPKA